MDRQKILKSSKNNLTYESNLVAKKIISIPFGPYLKSKDQMKVIGIFEKYKNKL